VGAFTYVATEQGWFYVAFVQRQLFFPIVLPHREMLPKSFIHFRPESEIDSDENLSIAGLFCGILNPVGEAEAGSGGDQPAKE
jgi:hypothetical protein